MYGEGGGGGRKMVHPYVFSSALSESEVKSGCSHLKKPPLGLATPEGGWGGGRGWFQNVHFVVLY